MNDYSKRELTSFKQALANATRLESIIVEFNALINNETWVFVPPPPDKTILSNKWIFCVKRLAFG